jgi:UDP-glucose 4-epimerase
VRKERKIWLVTGGAGYIGSHIADEFLGSGKLVVVYDSMKTGLESRIDYLGTKHKTVIPLIRSDIRNYAELERVFQGYEIEGIVHTAALKSVSESIENPKEYFEVNFEATLALIEFAKSYGNIKFIFSSTAAVYGNPDSVQPCGETGMYSPISPYGDSKLKAEGAVSDYLESTNTQGASLRFFNVIGSGAPQLEDNSTENLVPILLNRLRTGLGASIFGTDYPTPDGTCIRDYVDVRDISSAHLAVADSMRAIPKVMNIGTGSGSSVRSIVKMIEEISRRSFVEVNECPRREGDPALLCADIQLSKVSLGFEAKYKLEDSLRSLLFTPSTTMGPR